MTHRSDLTTTYRASSTLDTPAYEPTLPSDRKNGTRWLFVYSYSNPLFLFVKHIVPLAVH